MTNSREDLVEGLKAEEIAELWRLLERATPGPLHLPHFCRDDVGCQCRHIFAEGQDHVGAVCTMDVTGEHDQHHGQPLEAAKANAALIVAAVNALPRLLQSLSIPQGESGEWVLVPREPTEAMLEAVSRAAAAVCGSDLSTREMDVMCWTAGLAAAPSPTPSESVSVGGDGWATIESAPRDGTMIDLWWVEPGFPGYRIANAYWSGTKRPRPGRQDGWWGPGQGYEGEDGYIGPLAATHWRPLPAAPGDPS